MNALVVPIHIAIQDELGSLLHNAARYGEYETMVQLLDAGTSVNSKDIKGNTPLHIAAENGHEKIVSLLISRGASINQPDEDEDNCRLRTACYYGHLEMVKRCIGKAQTDSTDFAGNSALHLAAQNKKDLVEIVDILLESGFSIHKTDKLKRSALHLASRSGNCQIVII